MIFDSVPWKAQLGRDADELEAAGARRWSNKRSLLIERNVFLGAYAIRKLAEAHKLSTGLLDAPVDVKFFARTQPGYSAVRMMDLESYFAMDEPVDRQVPRARLLNVLIHSHVFVEVMGPRQRCTGFLVASDHSMAKGIYEVRLAEFIKLMRLVAEDFPTAIVLAAAEDGSWSVWSGHQDQLPDKLAPALSGEAEGE